MSTDDLTGSATTSVVARTPADLLGVIPYLLGFRPDRSLVMVVLRGSGVLFTARVDLPAEVAGETADGPGGGPDVTATRMGDELSRVVVQHGADGVVLVAYTPHRAAGVGFLTAVASRFAVPVEAAVCAGTDTWVGVVEGRPGPVQVYDPLASDGAAQAVVAGLVALPDRAAVVAQVRPESGRGPDAVAVAVVGLRERAASAAERPGTAAVRLARLLRDDGPWPPETVALLAWSVRTAEGFDQALRALRRPAERHLQRWSVVARRAPVELSGPPCTLAGLAAWLTGDGALARSWLERAMSEHPGSYGIGLLDHVLESAIAPTQWDPGH